MIRTYLDGSRYDGPGKRILCLGGIVAAESVLADFNEKWRSALENYGLLAFHMTDAMGRHGDFLGWKDADVDNFVKVLVNVILSFFDRHLRVKSCAIDLDEYEKARAEIPKLKQPEAMCIDFCCGTP